MISHSAETRKLYFGAGPAALPEEVLAEAAEAVRSFGPSGLSILEIPHRGKLFRNILDECEGLVRELCELTDDYEVLWMQGGGRMQFAMIPMNFLIAGKKAAYIDSGHWSYEGIEYAKHYGSVDVLASSRPTNYNQLPDLPLSISGDYTYLHYTSNNTIFGTQWPIAPATSIPLVADMSSDMLSRPVNFTDHALIYAVAQKNLGSTGATLVIVRKDLLQRCNPALPPMMRYDAHAAEKSILNTAPVFSIYTCLLTLRWIKAKGLHELATENAAKAAMLYQEIDRNPLFYGTVQNPAHRSQMNVCFRGQDEAIEKAFADLAKQAGIEGIEGHRSVGGFRASIYNAVPTEQVATLVALMQEFEHKYPQFVPTEQSVAPTN